MAFSPAGSMLAVATRPVSQDRAAASAAGIQLWSAATGAHVRSMHAQHCHAIQVPFLPLVLQSGSDMNLQELLKVHKSLWEALVAQQQARHLFWLAYG